MSEYSVNVVSLDVPTPPDYGGAIDIYYKVKALYNLGVDVYFHCYEYGRSPSSELDGWCKEVHYYPRKTGLMSNISMLPYITYSRRSHKLLERLRSNDYPIIFEGVHTIYELIKGEFKNRKILIRSHNIEHAYYYHLGKRENNPIKKAYFYKEAAQLRRLLNQIPTDVIIGAISIGDTKYFQSKFRYRTFWLPPFHSNSTVISKGGIGEYALYHGNLSVSENFEVATNLVKQFGGKNIPLVIAGKGPSPKFIENLQQYSNVQLVADPTEEEMNRLISDAQVILLPTLQPTGIKLKLIESLYRGRFCLANPIMIQGTNLDKAVTVIEISGFYETVEQLMTISYLERDTYQRDKLLSLHYSNSVNAKLIIDWLYGDSA